MTEPGHEDELSRRYRELAREEPPRALDEAILTAARRELETRPAPLVAPSGRRRWSVPLAAAAVIVLSAVVTLHMQREQPAPNWSAAPPAPSAPRGDETARAARPAPSPGAEAAASKPGADAGGFTPDPAPSSTPATVAPRSPPAATAPERRLIAPAAKPAPHPPAAPASAAVRESMESVRDAAPAREEASARAKRADEAESPERMLERIVRLRREGRQKEADDLYAEFRRRFPDYRIPEAMRGQVLPH